MVAFLYRCPATGIKVQGWVADGQMDETPDDSYISVTCLACRRAHLVNPSTGHIAGAEEKE